MANTLFTGKVYHRFDALPSTNDYARELLAKSKPPEGTVIRAASQSAGRGQYGSQWVSAANQNLTLSIILYPKWLATENQFRLSEAMALAVLEVTTTLLPLPADAEPVQLKWPNDIYIGKRKTAGILIQNSLNGHFLQSSIVGIGLNVNQLAFPPEAPNATSPAVVAGRMFDLDTVADTLFECVEQRYLQLKNGNIEALRADYHRHLLGLGEQRTFLRPDGSPFSGVIQEVAPDGRLVIQTNAGTELFAVKEVQFA